MVTFPYVDVCLVWYYRALHCEEVMIKQCLSTGCKKRLHIWRCKSSGVMWLASSFRWLGGTKILHDAGNYSPDNMVLLYCSASLLWEPLVSWSENCWCFQNKILKPYQYEKHRHFLKFSIGLIFIGHICVLNIYFLPQLAQFFLHLSTGHISAMHSKLTDWLNWYCHCVNCCLYHKSTLLIHTPHTTTCAKYGHLKIQFW